MPTEIVIEAEDRPGMMASLGELLGEAGVNITAAAAFTHDGRGFLHFVVQEADRAMSALRDAVGVFRRVSERIGHLAFHNSPFLMEVLCDGF